MRILWVALLIAAVLLMSGCGGGAEATEITSVKYSAKTEKIEVSATLDGADLKAYRGETIYLIEVPANNSEADILTLIPIAQSKAAGELNFSVSLSDGARTRLYSGFILASYSHSGGYKALGNIRYIDNPEALAKNKEEYPAYPGIKGLSILSSSDALTLGVRHTVVRVPIEEYLMASSEGEVVTDVFDGVTHYYNSKKLAELDYKIKSLSDSGVQVFLEFTLGASAEELPSALSSIAPKGAAAEASEGYAISVLSGDAYSHIAAFFEFVSERYTRSDEKYGFSAAYIIGRGVNSLEKSNVDAPQTLLESVSKYERLLRIAKTALLSSYAEGKVFVSLNNILNVDINEENLSDETSENADDTEKMPSAKRTLFGGAEYLDELFSEIEGNGDFEVGVALIPAASDSSSAVWNDINSENTIESRYITVKNLSVLRELIGEEREMMIYNYEISSEDETSMASSYAYAFLRAYEADVSAFVYGSHADGKTGSGETGLFRIDSDGDVKVEREIYGVFRDIDRIGAPEPEAPRLRIGDEWRTLYKKYGDDIKTFRSTSSYGTTAPDEKDAAREQTQLFDFSDGKNHNFFPSDGTAYIELCEKDGKKMMATELYPKYLGDMVGVRTPALDYETLKDAKTLKAVFSVELSEGNTAYVDLVLVSSGEELSIIKSRASVQTGNRQTVYFDIGDAEIEKDADVKAYVWVEGTGGRSPFYDDPASSDGDKLYIESISVIYKAKMPVWLIVLIILVIICALGFIGYRYAAIRTERKRRRLAMERRRAAAARRRGARPVGRGAQTSLGGRPGGPGTQRPAGARPPEGRRPANRYDNEERRQR